MSGPGCVQPFGDRGHGSSPQPPRRRQIGGEARDGHVAGCPARDGCERRRRDQARTPNLFPYRRDAPRRDPGRRGARGRGVGRDRQRHHLRGSFRQAPASRRAADDARYRVSRRLDGQADHVGGRAAARRAGQACTGRSGAGHRSGHRLTASARRLRCQRAPAVASGKAADLLARPADPHVRLHLPALGRHGRPVCQIDSSCCRKRKERMRRVPR